VRLLWVLRKNFPKFLFPVKYCYQILSHWPQLSGNMRLGMYSKDLFPGQSEAEFFICWYASLMCNNNSGALYAFFQRNENRYGATSLIETLDLVLSVLREIFILFVIAL